VHGCFKGCARCSRGVCFAARRYDDGVHARMNSHCSMRRNGDDELLKFNHNFAVPHDSCSPMEREKSSLCVSVC
jgi:hypothetical protein